MIYGEEDIIASDGFEADEEDDFDSVDYNDEFRPDHEAGADDGQAAGN